MKILIVKAHPLRNSLCSTLLNHVLDILKKTDHDVTVEDLYRSNFNPTLSAWERETYYADSYDSSEVSDQIEQLKNADALILIFPTWWFGFPAILKGWFDRVWVPGKAYDHADDYGPIRPRLDNLKKTLVVTTLGAPWWVDCFILRRPVKRIIRYALLGACAKNSRLDYLSFYKCESVSKKRLASFKLKIDSKLAGWYT